MKIRLSISLLVITLILGACNVFNFNNNRYKHLQKVAVNAPDAVITKNKQEVVDLNATTLSNDEKQNNRTIKKQKYILEKPNKNTKKNASIKKEYQNKKMRSLPKIDLQINKNIAKISTENNSNIEPSTILIWALIVVLALVLLGLLIPNIFNLIIGLLILVLIVVLILYLVNSL